MNKITTTVHILPICLSIILFIYVCKLCYFFFALFFYRSEANTLTCLNGCYVGVDTHNCIVCNDITYYFLKNESLCLVRFLCLDIYVLDRKNRVEYKKYVDLVYYRITCHVLAICCISHLNLKLVKNYHCKKK